MSNSVITAYMNGVLRVLTEDERERLHSMDPNVRKLWDRNQAMLAARNAADASRQQEREYKATVRYQEREHKEAIRVRHAAERVAMDLQQRSDRAALAVRHNAASHALAQKHREEKETK